MTAAEIVDAAAGQPTLVVGSLPPAGRDLDVLTREPDAIADALRNEGFVTRGNGEWLRAGGGTVEAVDVIERWPMLDELFEDARPVEGFTRLVRPAPAQQLLLLAQLLRRTGTYKPGRVERMRTALAEDPAAADEARRRAARWGVEEELARVLAGEPVALRRPPRRPRVVGLSGIDGSGKSTQARALAEALELLGYDVEIAWAPLGSSKVLRAIFLPLRNALGRLRSFQPAAPAEDTGLVPNAGSVIRDRSAVAHAAWSSLIAWTNGLFHARTAAAAAARGRVVIFDRYVLDSRVRLRFLYGTDRSYALQDAIVRMLSPKPLGAFFLDVDAEASLSRKDDRWSETDLARLVGLYRELDDGTVTRYDGTRPREELTAEITTAVWLALG